MSDQVVWDGKPENLPEPWKPFEYKDGQFVVANLGDMKVICDTKKGLPDFTMSVRAFPGKSGSASIDVLYKAGLAEAEKLATIVEQGEEAIFDLSTQFFKLVTDQKDLIKWLHEKGITRKELMEAIEEYKLAATIAILLE